MHLFKDLFRRRGSSEVAKARLQNILFQDRMDLPANFLEMVACDVKQAVSAYLELPGPARIRVARHIFDGVSMPAIEVILPVKNVHKPQKHSA